jgi:type I restriction enzyme S subunit
VRGNITFERIDVMHLPELPKGWIWVSISEVIEKVSLTNKKLKKSQYQKKGNLPVIDQGQEFIGGFTDREELKITCHPVIVFGDHTKVIKFINFDFVAGADGVKVIKPLEMFYPKLFYYFLQVIQLPDKGYARHCQFLEKSLIPLPSLPEQKRIVEKIEELFTRLEAGVEALKKVKAQIMRYRQAVLKYAFEGKLTEEWRKHAGANYGVGPENIKKGKHIGSPIQDDLSPLPEGWVWVRLGEVAEINPKFIGNNLPEDIEVTFLPMKCVEELTGHIDLSNTKKLSDVKEGYTPFIEGDVLFAKITPCMENGKVAIAHNLKNSIGFGSTEFHVIRPQAPLYNRFLFFFLLQEGLRKDAQRNMTGSAGQLRVPVSYMQQIPLPLPHLPEQRQIVSEIERRFSVSDEVEKVVDQSLKQAERLKQSILKKAFEGKLVPQNPNDEPAERLLERIRLKEDKNIKDHKVSAII